MALVRRQISSASHLTSQTWKPTEPENSDQANK